MCPRYEGKPTPKAAKGGASVIEGQGVHAVEVIAGGEVVAVKGGHILDGSAVAGLAEAIRDSAFPIAADCFLAALTRDEYDGVMMRVNHSCEPNVGMGQCHVEQRDRVLWAGGVVSDAGGGMFNGG